MSVGLLLDTTKCIGCNACSAACKEQNGLPQPIEPKTTAYTWTVVRQQEGVNVRNLCMHCLTPTCASVCPVGALEKLEAGPVVYDSGKCIGCRYCIMACPFGVPKYQWDRPIPIVGKCILCAPRVAKGQATACATVCPTGATLFGQRDQLLAEAHRRLEAEPGRYHPGVYGESEAGGTAVLRIASRSPESLGLKTGLPKEPLPMLTWQVLSKIPDFAVVWGAFLLGLHWITKRRDEVAHAEGASPPGGAATGAPHRQVPGPAARPGRRS